MDIFNKISLRIITEQEQIIGPIAWAEARKVPGFKVLDEKTMEISFDGDKKEVINKLVAQYEILFGKASHAVCHDAVQDIVAEMSPEDVPSSLK